MHPRDMTPRRLLTTRPTNDGDGWMARRRQREAARRTRESVVVGGLLPLALLAGGYATDLDDEAA